VNPVRIGRLTRTLRRRLGWRQVDLARRAGVSQQTVSLVETGRSRRLALATLEKILGHLEADVYLVVRWRGGELDRVIDAPHASLLGSTADLLGAAGWLARAEVTYAIGRDRGSIDLLGFNPTDRAVLVVEVKSDVTSADSTLRRHDEKVRLAARIALERFGWVAASVSGLLVLPDASTPRRRIAALGSLFDRSYPLRGRALRRWMHRPDGPMRGILFLPITNAIGDRRALTSRRRIQRPARGLSERGVAGRVPLAGGRFVDSSGEHQADW
jgi:transcriptional regulator with XRE-family HTH domain